MTIDPEKHYPIKPEKYGFFFWFLLFGFAIVIFSIIKNPDYIELGLIFCCFGFVSYVIATLIDRYIKMKYPEEKDKPPPKVPMKIYIRQYVAIVILFGVAIWLIEIEYDFF